MKLFLATLALTVGSGAFAEVITNTRVLKDATTLVALELNKDTVFCTDLGYGNVQLKINVPELDDIAHFDHRVVGEGLPCITGGECTADLGPGNILDGAKPIEIVPVRVVLSEAVVIDEAAKTCVRHIQENVQSMIRGREFLHIRNSSKNEKLEKCLAVARLSM